MYGNRNTKLFFIFFILFAISSLCFAKAGTKTAALPAEDDIFKHQKIEKDDFLEIKKEPKKEDLKKGLNRNIEEVKNKKKKALEDKERALKELEAKNKKLSQNLPKTPPKTGNKQNNKTQQNKTQADVNSKIKTEDTIKNGTTKKDEVALEKKLSLREKFINFCMDLRGTRYVWGGKTPSQGLDCSGLVTYGAKKSLGIDLSGNSQNIYDKTEHISLEEAVPGDLVFFKAAGEARISHVGIFLGKNYGENDFGNQYLFLNSASAGPRTGVIISGLNENYWKKTYYGCGRFLGEI